MRTTTIRDIAREVGVSGATVSRALNRSDRVAPETAQRVWSSANRLGYVRNEVARNLVGGRTSSLAVIVPDITNPFFPELVAGIEATANEYQNTLHLAQDNDKPQNAAELINNLKGRQVRGFIVVGGQGYRHHGNLLDGVPHVVIDRPIDSTNAPVVRSDNRMGGYLATEHLISLGHREILWIGGPADSANNIERLAGLHDAFSTANLIINTVIQRNGDYLEESGFNIVNRVLASGTTFTAIMAANDLMAIGALRALHESGKSVPEDVSVVGFDDIHLARYVNPGLTTIRQQIAAMGRHSALMLLDPRQARSSSVPMSSGNYTFKVELVHRKTTGPANNSSISMVSK